MVLHYLRAHEDEWLTAADIRSALLRTRHRILVKGLVGRIAVSDVLIRLRRRDVISKEWVEDVEVYRYRTGLRQE